MEKRPINEGSTRGVIKGGVTSTTAGFKKDTAPVTRPAPPPPIKKK